MDTSLYAAALPTLDIAEGALDKIFGIYKELLPAIGGYLTEAGQLNRRRLQMLLDRLSQLEQQTLELRAQVARRLRLPSDFAKCNCQRHVAAEVQRHHIPPALKRSRISIHRPNCWAFASLSITSLAT